MSWSDGRELREHRQLGRKLESRWGSPQLGSYGQPALAEYDSDDNLIDVDVPHDLLDSRSHFFRSKVFKHPNTCQVCNEVIWNEGRSCRACKFACHRKCQYKVTTECKSSVNNAQPSNSYSRPQTQHTQLKLKNVSIDSNQNKMTAHVHAEISPVSRGGESHIKYSFDLDVDYITERLIGVSFPSGGLEAQYRSNLRDVVRMLKSKHQDNYVIFNLSQKRHDLNKLNPQVYDLGWPDHLAPPLEKLCSICKHIETWLKAESQHVVVLHCKGGRGPIGMIVLAYMNYINITSNSETAMDRYAMKRFLEAKTESAMHPSQHRYVNYFTGLLMRSIQVNSTPLFLHHVLIHGVPNYDINGGCRPFLRVYQGMQPIYTSPVFSVPEGTSRFAITLDQALPIRGDVLIKCYHKKSRATTRDVIFRCQFHTTAIMECRLVYQKSDLDDACTDARFPEFTKVEFVFSQTPDRLHGSDYVPGSNFPADNSDDPLIRWDSYENFETTIDGGDYSPEIIDLSINMNNNIPHSSAPDGSLYAEVQKTPSPIRQENPFFSSPYHAVPPTSPTSNQLKPIMPGAIDYEMGPRSPMQTTQMAVLRAKMNAQKDPGYQTSRQRTPSPRTPTSDPPSPLQPPTPLSTQPISQSPAQRPTELMNGPKSTPETPSTPQQKRMMNYKERRDLDDLLRGIGDNAPVIPSSDSQGSRDEVVEKRKIVDVQAQMSQLPPVESQCLPTPKIYHPQPRSALDLENPYAEITDAVPNRGLAQNPEASQPNQPPVVEQIAFTRVETVESVKMPDFDKLRTPQNHDNPTYAATRERDQLSQSSAPQRTPNVSHLNNGNQYAYPFGSNQPSSVWEPQPLRAKKEQLVFIYKEDPISPRGPPVPPLPEEYLRNQSDQPDSSKLLSGSRTSAEVGDDAMTWLQKQQQKLKEKREREGVVDNPTFQTPKRELPRVPEPIRELPPRPDRVPEPMYQSQLMTATRDEIPTDNMTWLEQKQRKLQEKRQQEEQSNPSFINTSHQGPSYGTPSRTDSSGLSSTANGSLTRPQLTDLEKSINQLSNIKSPDAPTTHGPMTPPHTYEHESNLVQLEMWQSHQRPLNRQASDTTFDREKPVSLNREKDLNQAPQTRVHVASESSPAGSKHRSEKRSQSQTHNVWQRREEQDDSQTEQRAVSADRLRLYTTDHLDNSTRMDGGTAGHAIGSSNYGTVRSRHTNHSYNANPASVVTSGMSQGDQTNQNVNNINLMAGLEDAIRMLSEWTYLQNQELSNPGRSNSPPRTKHNTHVSDVVHRGDVTTPPRQPNLPNGWIGHSANHQSHTEQHRQQGSAGAAKEEMFEKVDLHIDESQIKEPLRLQRRGMDKISDVNVGEHPKSQPPTGPLAKPSKSKQMPRHTPHQSGYDSDSAVQQYYEAPMSNHPGRVPSPETWLHNPGGLPVHESEYWNRMEGLKSPNPKEQWARKPEQQDYCSSSESLQNGGVTPRFPVGPKAYKNMVSTPIAIVGRPPHSPDAPYPLSPIKWDDRDVLDTSGLQLSPSRQLTTQTASPMNVDSPMPTSAQNTTPGTPEIITVTRKRIVQNEVNYTHSEPVEVLPPRPQLPILATVERLPAPTVQTENRVPQNAQHYPLEVKVDRVPVTNYSIQEPVSDSKAPGKPHHPIGGFPPSPKKEVTFQDARGGVPEKLTGPQTLAGSRDSPIIVQEQEIVPTRKVPVEVAPTWPIELEVHIKNEGMGPAISDVEVKGNSYVSQTSPQLISSSVQYYKHTTYSQEPASPALKSKPHDDKAQPIMILEPELQQEMVVQKEQKEPGFSSANLSAQPPPPQYPTYSDRMKNKPPPPMYPTFSDRHRKAAAGRTEEVSPQVANGYHTMYDNRGSGRVKRASTGSDGMWPARSPNQRKASDGGAGTSVSGRTTPSNFYLMQHPSPYSSSLSLADTSLDKVRFVKDLSAWWYKPHISRDEAIAMLKDKSPGTFVVRDSNSFPGAFGLAVKVAQLPPNAPPSKKATDPASELVRHFLIEPNPRGVRLKGCANEPIFGSLSALIYQHTLTQLALPCKLQLPEIDPSGSDATDSALDPKSAHNLLSQGAACNVLFLGTVEMESLTGPSAVGEATTRIMKSKEKPKRVVVHFKVSLKGITITDNQRKLFFRKHYPVESVLYCGMDSGTRKWKRKDGSDVYEAKIFGFVARKPGSKTDNQCHVFAEYEIEQPASAIVSFVTKVLLGSFQNHQVKTP